MEYNSPKMFFLIILQEYGLVYYMYRPVSSAFDLIPTYG